VSTDNDTRPREEALVAELRQGSRSAFRRAVAEYSGAMLATAASIAGTANAEDIVQDAWLVVYRKIDSFEGRAGFGTWLQRIVINRAISITRKTSREQSLPETTFGEILSARYSDDGDWRSPPPAWHTSSADELLTASELQDCLDKHLSRMPEQQRTALVLRDMHGLAFDEICNMLDITATNARVLAHRGRLRLMTMVDKFEETGIC